MPLHFSSFSRSKPSPPLRIADVLLLQDHEEDRLLLMNSSRGLNCSTPPRIASRFFSGFQRGKLAKRIPGEVKKEDDAVALPVHVTDGPDLSSEICRRESDFNVEKECWLLHLIAESKNELRKMTELRIQMESVLQKVKEELLNKDLLVSKKLESDDGDGVEESLDLKKILFDQSLKCDDGPKEEDCLEGMDRLEAELEVELERLQLHLDSGKFSTNPPEETIEESIVNTSAISYSISYGEVIDPTIDDEDEGCPDSHCGVHPYELERKLHELLETRQEQQIRELEAALESARQELREKEREISWWKGTAHLMSGHIKEPSLLNFQHGPHAHHLR